MICFSKSLKHFWECSIFRKFVFLLYSICLSLPLQAKAENWDFLQFTCSPELNYFSMQTLALDLPSETLESFAKVRKSNLLSERDGLYVARNNLNKPYICKLPRRTVSAEIANFIPGHERGECAMPDRFDVRIEINAVQVDEFPAYGVNRCTVPETHNIQLNSFGLTNCAIPYPVAAARKTTCTAIREWNLPH